MEVLAWVGGLASVAYVLLRLAARVANRGLHKQHEDGQLAGNSAGEMLSGQWMLAPDKQHPVYTRPIEVPGEVESGPPEPGVDEQES